MDDIIRYVGLNKQKKNIVGVEVKREGYKLPVYFLGRSPSNGPKAKAEPWIDDSDRDVFKNMYFFPSRPYEGEITPEEVQSRGIPLVPKELVDAAFAKFGPPLDGVDETHEQWAVSHKPKEAVGRVYL